MKKVFYIHINDDDNTGMNAISLVENPAVQYDFLCFSEENSESKLIKFQDDEKHIITGVVCLADTPIYRYDKGIGDYYVVFTPETIEKMMLKYSNQKLNNNVDLQHNGKLIAGITMFESYVKCSNRGVNPAEFSDIPDGSWIASFKVEDNNLWNEIKTSGKLNGFSLSGIFDMSSYKFSEENTIDNLIDEFLEDK